MQARDTSEAVSQGGTGVNLIFMIVESELVHTKRYA
eukprot:COSAG01_NODE_462_length_16681_cov_4.001206_6_plen_36_part_00